MKSILKEIDVLKFIQVVSARNELEPMKMVGKFQL